MATESVGDDELSITLSPPLSAWLDDRAAALGVDRETLILRLLESDRTAADMDEDELSSLVSAAVADADTGIDPEEFDALGGRVDDVETSLSEHVDDLRSRILQLKSAVESSAAADHEHAELETLSERVDSLSGTVDGIEDETDAVASELDGIASEFDALVERVGGIETKLDRLARAVVALKRRADGETDADERLGSIRETANRNGTTTADCGGCGETVRIGLLSEAACPHCQHAFEDIEYSDSILRRLWSPTLVGTDQTPPKPPEDGDE